MELSVATDGEIGEGCLTPSVRGSQAQLSCCSDDLPCCTEVVWGLGAERRVCWEDLGCFVLPVTVQPSVAGARGFHLL